VKNKGRKKDMHQYMCGAGVCVCAG
jgi:hypothetical protein